MKFQLSPATPRRFTPGRGSTHAQICPCRGPLALVSPLVYFSNICSNIHRHQGEVVKMSAQSVPAQVIPAHEVVSDGGLTPIEFTFKGRRFRIHAVLSRWCEAGGWWNRISDGKFRPDDQARALWTVEAAPIGALTTFQLERDETTGQWIVRPI